MPKATNNDKMEDFFACLSADTAFMSALQANTVSVQQDQCIACAAEQAQFTTTALTLEDFWHLFARHTDKAPLQLSGAVHAYQKWKKEHRNAERSAKRTLANDLGLKDHALPYAKLADIIPDLAIIYRDCDEARQHKRGTILVDAGNEDLIAGATSPTLVVPLEGEDWYVVTPEKSAIFVNTEGEIELVVIHGCCGTHPDILEYVNGVISEAVNDRKGVCPSHGGELIQYGWNAGARHVQVFGLVRNLTKKNLTNDERQQKDGAILGILALTWNLLTTTLPEEVVAPTKAAIADAGLPSMASKDDVNEHGYYLDLPCGRLHFQDADRSPAEAYMSQNYTSPIHQDHLYAPYAFNWVTEHQVYDRRLAKITHRNGHSSGGNYVDVSLRVVIHCAADTAMCLWPAFKHGTTLARPGTWRQGTAINFSTHIKDAYDAAVKAGGIELMCNT
ncbi:hypothetical protein BKA82DRAFT_1001376 [Pisolithus tinctorius]|nr:hypothetical protein BKA82DRAFT_1001376 [Pisolithus tinctorius]